MGKLNKRLKKIERILAVQEKLHQLAEWKLARIDEEGASIRSDEQSIVEALNDHESLQGLFVEAMARRLAVLARETERVNRAREEQTKRLFAEALRLGWTERMTERLRRKQAEELWRQGFKEILETVGRKRDASFP